MKFKNTVLIFSAIILVSQAAALDLQEANVMDVEKNGDRFSVTLIHDDSGEDGYANWWQVETMEGEQLGRRTLLHAHGTRNFTRSESIQVPDGIEKVVVRGHDQTHGYGGRAAIYTIETGQLEFVDQGEERNSFGESIERNISEENETDTKNNSEEVRQKDIQEKSNTDSRGFLYTFWGGIADFIF